MRNIVHAGCPDLSSSCRLRRGRKSYHRGSVRQGIHATSTMLHARQRSGRLVGRTGQCLLFRRVDCESPTAASFPCRTRTLYTTATRYSISGKSSVDPKHNTKQLFSHVFVLQLGWNGRSSCAHPQTSSSNTVQYNSFRAASHQTPCCRVFPRLQAEDRYHPAEMERMPTSQS